MKKTVYPSRFLILVSLLALLLMSADTQSTLVRLKVVNQSGMNVALKMRGKQEKQVYYLQVSSGTKDAPQTETFTVIRDRYNSQLFYIESWDPVYGYGCSNPRTTINAQHNVTIYVKPCGTATHRSSEDYVVKISAPQERSSSAKLTTWEKRQWRFNY